MAKRKLPKKLDAGTVSARVDRLFYSKPMKAYHGAIPTYRALTLMRLDENLPESFNSGTSMSLPHSRIIEVVGALLGKAAGFVRYTDAVAKAERSGVPSQKLVDKADRVGRTLTVMNAGLDAGKRKSRAGWGHQLVDGFYVLHLHRRKRPGRGFGWEVEVADPLTCAFTEEAGGAFVPKRFARKFSVLLSDVQARYAHKGDLTKDSDGGFAWAPLSAPRAIDEGTALDGTGGSGSDQGEGNDVEVELCIYEDGYYVYHLVRSPSGGTGGQSHSGATILYCERNTTYTPAPDGETDEDYEAECGAMAVVVPGDTYSFGGDGEKMLPVTFAILNVVNNLNILRAIRGRSAIKDRPDMVAGVNVTPEEFEQLQKLGALKAVDGEDGGGSVVYVPGKDVSITPWQLRSNQDLDSLDQTLKDDLQVAVSELLVNTDPNVVAAASATAYHISTGETGQRHTGWLGNADFAWAAVDQMICNAVVNDEDEYDFVASEAQPRSGSLEVPQGEYLPLTPDMLSFPFVITVATKQETEDQKNKRLMNANFLRHEGVRTLINVIEEDTEDVTKRVQELFEDKVRIVTQPVIITRYVVPAMDSAIRTGAGMNFDLRAEDFRPPQAPGAPVPNVQPTQTFAPAPQDQPVEQGSVA